jgi:hypothetical protein
VAPGALASQFLLSGCEKSGFSKKLDFWVVAIHQIRLDKPLAMLSIVDRNAKKQFKEPMKFLGLLLIHQIRVFDRIAAIEHPTKSLKTGTLFSRETAVSAVSAAAFFAGLSLVDSDFSTEPFCSIEFSNGCIFLGIARHFYKCEAALSACLSVGGKADTTDFAVFCKNFP